MDIKQIIKFGLLFVMLSLFYSCGCDDEHGNRFHMVVPFNSMTKGDTITTNDTIYFSTNFSKDVELEGQESTVFLENFNFHTKLIVSDLSDTLSNYNYRFSAIEDIGDIDTLLRVNSFSFPLRYHEDLTSYSFSGGLVIRDPGIYYLRWSTNRGIIGDYYDHPALYQCEDDRRSDIRVLYRNESSTQENYDKLFQKTKDPVYLSLTYDEYRNFGGHTFVVVE